MEGENQSRNKYPWLKPHWKPGESGNPAGRPRRPKCIPEILREIGALKCPEELVRNMREKFGIKGDITVQQAALLATYQRAVKGEAWAMEFIADRTEGKAVQPVDLNGPPGPLIAIINPPTEREKLATDIEVKTIEKPEPAAQLEAAKPETE